jgi:L-2,4-diaminobutyrate decarboxylase
LFDGYFFGSRPEGMAQYRRAILDGLDLLSSALPANPYSGYTPEQLRRVARAGIEGFAGAGRDDWKQHLGAVIQNSIALWDPHVAAHLHTPVLAPALAAELVLSALNQSMDSFDQAPAATLVEQELVVWLCRLAGLPEAASGSFTTGGTQSNYLGLLLARDEFIERRWAQCVRTHGLPPDARRLRILCSEAAHFSVEKSAIQLGLGTQSVVRVATDKRFRLSATALKEAIHTQRRAGFEPMVVVATAGTTDFGSIDPLEPISAVAAENGLWLHVDAAYGGALLLSKQHRRKLAGLAHSDSIGIDFHKAFFQPIPCSAFLLRDAAHFRHVRVHADYLNPEQHEAGGIPDLVTTSVLTTRRFDALKLWVSLQAMGVDEVGSMIDRLLDLARIAAQKLAEERQFTLWCKPELGSVVFRYVPQDCDVDADAINAALPQSLFNSGAAVVGHTVVRSQNFLKLTFCNPCVSEPELDSLLRTIAQQGRELEKRDSMNRIAG